MRLGSVPARDRFPRLLGLLAEHPELYATFEEGSQAVPCWMFLSWISQLLAILARPESEAVLPIIFTIASSYPQAIYYAFRISSESLEQEGPLPPEVQVRLAQIREHLRLPLLDQFVEALSGLTHPQHRFKDIYDEIIGFYPTQAGSKLSANDRATVGRLWKKLIAETFQKAGQYNESFAHKYRQAVQEAFPEGRVASMTRNQVEQAYASLSEKWRTIPHGVTKLAHFSPWLADFDASDHIGRSIEIPGQYTGLERPTPEHHVSIASFDHQLLVLRSMRRPKKVVIRGNDQRDYPFLVKGGEDLRLDQRVQQIFSVMNQIFTQDPACSTRQIHIRTYHVLPMTPKLGILEWIPDTLPLKQIIEQELKDKTTQEPVSLLSGEALEIHDRFLNKFSKQYNKSKREPSIATMYATIFEHASPEEVKTKLKLQHASVPKDLLRNGILALAASPEAYLSIRAHFATTLASFNIASYIIGIGDRHLENFLLDLHSGGLIGIDFGHAFGTGIQILPIPELVPFRLTRQFCSFLMPLDVEGLLKHTMVHTLSALQRSKDILLSTMDVFIKEPLIDWTIFARKFHLVDEENKHDKTFFPEQKIAFVKQKLEGHNPAEIMCQELDLSIHKHKQFLPHLKYILRDKRRSKSLKLSGPKVQVDYLCSLATDPHILGMAYAGWIPWC